MKLYRAFFFVKMYHLREVASDQLDMYLSDYIEVTFVLKNKLLTMTIVEDSTDYSSPQIPRRHGIPSSAYEAQHFPFTLFLSL